MRLPPFTTEMEDAVQLEIWSDPLYPTGWFIFRRLAVALERFEGRDDVDVVWRSFEILPELSRVPGETLAELKVRMAGDDPEVLAARIAEVKEIGAAEGIELNLATAQPVNSFDAHRLIHCAAAHGVRDQAVERTFAAYCRENVNIADHAVLQRLGEEIGLDAGVVAELLAGDAYADDVFSDRARAVSLGVSGVPTCVVDGVERATGDQSVEQLLALFSAETSSSDM
jgi:predicted DsbA family dithiol-disulfide isomerase